jgi:hypothetical protein
MVRVIAFLLLLSICKMANAQVAQKNLVFVDSKGVLRFTRDNREASFFGVNYTVPFAYGYRSHKALGMDIEKAIDADVYHLSRLGLDAFRVHVWDVEISDSLGNLLQNEHLRLFDYLIQKLKERKIKILLTPIAFWGNGYPEKDEKTNGFSSVYGKGNAVVLEPAIKAQENYLQQFFRHINPYTKLSYKDDSDVIATEINNEPHHSGPKEKTSAYINRLAAAIKSTGWTKPIFYNISESPSYADAVTKASVDGYSFQWYPTGLVAGHEQKGNYLPNVDQYYIPFIDTIPQFRNKARMVYEFDAGDVLQSNMYPAMVRSFRTAGFQWATQFAYDPMATAYANTEYQTHYLNLAYTPSKAISLLIASKAFHRLPRLKSYGAYPADTVFDVFRVSYPNNLSEMNSEEEFYYSNSTTARPVNPTKLKHIAGVGTSPVVAYEGTGAYFFDQLEEGIWRLEVMPNALHIRDPFEKASPKKMVTAINWQAQPMKVNLPDLAAGWSIQPVNEGNVYTPVVQNSAFIIQPGVYLLTRQNKKTSTAAAKEFFAPRPSPMEPLIRHLPLAEVSAGKSFALSGNITGLDSLDKVSIELHTSSNKWKTLIAQHTAATAFTAEVPADMVTPGVLNYRILLQKANKEFYTFPGGYKGDPYAWDNVNNDSWQTWVSPGESPLVLFNATADRNSIILYNTDWRNNSVEYITADKPGQLVLKTTLNKPALQQTMGWQYFFADKIRGRYSDLSSFTTLVIRARSAQKVKVKASLITRDAQAFSAYLTPGADFSEIEIPLSLLKKDSCLLLPRPYPGFQPLWFMSPATKSFDINDIEKLEISFGALEQGQVGKPLGVEVASVWLKK